MTIRRAVSRVAVREKRKDAPSEPRGYTVAERNVAVSKAKELPSVVAGLISEVQRTPCFPIIRL